MGAGTEGSHRRGGAQPAPAARPGDQGSGQQRGAGDGGEIEQAGEFQVPPGQAVEPELGAEGGQKAVEAGGQGIAGQAPEDIPAQQQQQEQQGHGADEGGHLFAQQGGGQQRHGIEAHQQQRRGEIAGKEHARVRRAQIPERGRKGGGEKQRDQQQCATGQELAQDDGPDRQRQGQQQLDAAVAGLVDPGPHGQGRHHQERNPGQKGQKGPERGFVGGIEIGDQENARRQKDQEAGLKDIGERGVDQ